MLHVCKSDASVEVFEADDHQNTSFDRLKIVLFGPELLKPREARRKETFYTITDFTLSVSNVLTLSSTPFFAGKNLEHSAHEKSFFLLKILFGTDIILYSFERSFK